MAKRDANGVWWSEMKPPPFAEQADSLKKLAAAGLVVKMKRGSSQGGTNNSGPVGRHARRTNWVDRYNRKNNMRANRASHHAAKRRVKV